MTIRRSTGLVNKMLDVSPVKTLFTDAILTIYSGFQPATADLAATGTKLATISGSGVITWGTAANGSIDIAAAVSTTALANGTMGWFRLCESTDNPDLASTVNARVDGSLATSGGQLNFPGGTAVLTGQTIDLSALPITLAMA